MRRFVTLIAVLAFVAVGCQAATEGLTEQVLEQQEGVEDVNINTDTGEISVETEDGSFSLGGGEIPDGFPVPLPDGYEVLSVVEADNDAAVTVFYPKDRWEEIVSFFETWTAGQPGEWTSSNYASDLGDGTEQRGANWSEAQTQISVADCFGMETGEPDSVCVSVIVSS
jgi:hypothetical protein